MSRVRAEKMLFWCAVGTVSMTLLVIADLGMVSLIALLCCYAFEAIMFPTVFALALRGLGSHTKRASSFLMMSPVGGAVGPLLMGYVADTFSMSLSFIVPLLGYVVVLGYARSVLKKR
jgi:FHS family L-fucose permease-like MFS transporter